MITPAKTLDIPMIAAILRSASDVSTPDVEVSQAKAEGYAKGLEDGRVVATHDTRDLVALKEKVRQFEKESGIGISSSWHGGADIGLAVRMVMEGQQERFKNTLLRVAKEIIEGFGQEADK